jgi:hypothetical protein
MKLLLQSAENCMSQLQEAHVWYRAHPRDNSIGNLVLHVVGNLRQWILGGIDGRSEARDRAAEFSTSKGQSKDELARLVHETVQDCCHVIESLPIGRITEARRIQDADTTIAYALVMVVSHLAVHVGQIQFMTRSLLQEAYRETWTTPATLRTSK